MKKNRYKVILVLKRANRPNRTMEQTVLAYSIKEGVNKAKLKSFIKTGIPIDKWKMLSTQEI